jgi:hypothetical protein
MGLLAWDGMITKYVLPDSEVINDKGAADTHTLISLT